jgi:hypothetical protein
MKKILLTKGVLALVNDDMFDYLNQWKWSLHHGYATRTDRGIINGKKYQRTIAMHRVIANTPEDKITDHINRNPLDNRSSNLRICSKAQNACNTEPYKTNRSGYVGVRWKTSNRKWVARINLAGKQIHIGYFTDLLEAAKAYDAKALELHGEFAKLNFNKG